MTISAPNLTDPALIADPFGGYGRLREEAPVLLGASFDGSPAWYVTRQEDVRTALSDHRFVMDPDIARGTGSGNPRAATPVRRSSSSSASRPSSRPTSPTPSSTSTASTTRGCASWCPARSRCAG